MVNVRQAQAMIRHAQDAGPGLCEERDATTWICGRTCTWET